MSVVRSFLGRLQRVEKLVKRAIASANTALAQIALLPPPLPSGQIIGLPNNNIRQTGLSIPVNQAKPYFIVFTFMARIPSSGLCQWQRQHVCVHGDPALPVIVPSIGGGDFTTTEAGFGSTPSVFVTLDPVAPHNLLLQASNPLAQPSALDVSFNVDVLDIGAT